LKFSIIHVFNVVFKVISAFQVALKNISKTSPKELKLHKKML